MMSGSRQAYENGITTQTEEILCSGNQTNPSIRLNAKEEEYVLSQLIQRNFDKRRGLSVFTSKSKRSSMLKVDKQAPPVGLYEHEFGQPTGVGSPLSRVAKSPKEDTTKDS